MTSDLHFSDVTESWFEIINELQEDEEVYIFSPYITGTVIEELYEQAKSKNFRLVTKLDVRAYLSGSLDLDVLRRLIYSGVKVFHHSKLHAKMLLTQHIIVVGSQNFTKGGRTNLEASMIAELDEKKSQKARKEATDIISEAILVSRKTIQKFQEKCDLMLDLNQEFMNQICILEKSILVEGILDDPTHQARQKIKNFKRILKASDKYVWTRLVKRETDYSTYWTLMRTPNQLQLNDFFTDYSFLLRRKYLCLDAETHSTFLVKANKSQIGVFYKDIFISLDGYVRGQYRKTARLTCLMPSENKYFANLKLKFNHDIFGRFIRKLCNLVVHIYFDGLSLKIKAVTGTFYSPYKDISDRSNAPQSEEIELLEGDSDFKNYENFFKPKLKKIVLLDIQGSDFFLSEKTTPEKLFDVNKQIQLHASIYRGANFFTIFQKKD